MIENENVWISYDADGEQRQFEFPYQYVRPEDISLYVEHDGTLTKIQASLFQFSELTKKVTYPIDPEADPVPAGDTVLLWRETDVNQEEDSTVSNFKSNDVERMVDKLTMICQELSDKYNRAVHFEPTDVYDTDATTYVKTITDARDIAIQKAGEALESAEDSEASSVKSQKWAEGTDQQVAALGGTHSSKGWAAISQTAAESDNVQTVIANMDDINAVADIKNSVTTVAGISNQVVAVSNNASDISTVASNNSKVSTVSQNINSVNTVASISSKVNTVATISSSVTAVANNETNVNTVASNVTNIGTVAANNSTITAVAANASNINAVAGNATNINAVAGNATNINAVNSNKTNINKVASKITEVNTVAGSIENVNTVATNVSNVNKVAAIDSDVSAVAADLENIDTAVENLPDLQDKQNKVLTTPLTINGQQETTVDGALGALNTSRAELDSNNRLKDEQNPYASDTYKGAVKITIDEEMGYLDIYTEAY